MTVKTRRGAKRKFKVKSRSARSDRLIVSTRRAKAGHPPRGSIGAEIIAGLEEAVAFERGEARGVAFREAPITARDAQVLPAPSYSGEDVARIRQRLQVSQDIFAQLLDVSAATVRSWEQKQKPPSGAARRLLQLAEMHPEILLEQIRRSANRGGGAA